MEDELVGGEEETAKGALDTLGSRRVVAGREESSAASPSTLVVY
jgi:hypothetical protein